MQRGGASGHGTSRSGRHNMRMSLAQMVGVVSSTPVREKKRTFVVEKRRIEGPGVRREIAPHHA